MLKNKTEDAKKRLEVDALSAFERLGQEIDKVSSKLETMVGVEKVKKGA